ncbi:MAG: hypothetical protein Q9218_008163, partial [Villophora microphyllina]
ITREYNTSLPKPSPLGLPDLKERERIMGTAMFETEGPTDKIEEMAAAGLPVAEPATPYGYSEPSRPQQKQYWTFSDLFWARKD